MTHADAFLQDILAHPDDDAPRLIFADWLEEQGDAASIARAEFIRVQCALAAGNLPPTRRAELERREKQILNEWSEKWVRPIRRLVKNWEFDRGFIYYVAMFSDTFLKRASRLFRHAPVQHLRLLPRMYPQSFPLVEPIDMAALADSKYLKCLLSLSLSENQLESRHVNALVVSEHLTRLAELDLSFNRIGDGGIRALMTSPLLSQLTDLDLSDNEFGPAGVRVLARSLLKLANSAEGLHLRRLDLSSNNLGAAGHRLIADSRLLRQMVRV